MLKAARRALAAVDDIHRIPIDHGVTDILRVATVGAMAAGMAPILEQFIRQQPDTRVQILHVSRDDEMIDMLRRHDIDVAYGSLARPPRGLTLTPTRPLEIVLASPIGTQLPAKVTLKQLDRLPMLCPPLTEERRRLLDEPCERAGATPRIVMESSDSTTYLSGIRAGIGSSAMWDVNAEQATGIEVRRFDPKREIVVGFVHPTKPAANVRTLLAISRRLDRQSHQKE